MKTKTGISLLISLLLVTISTFINPHFVAANDLKIAIILWRGETDAEKGFKEKLKELGYSVQYTTLNANQKKSQVGNILRKQLKPDDFDYVYTFGTTVSKLTKNFLKGRAPQIFNIVTDPVKAGLVNSLESSGSNICGVKLGIPLDLQIKNALEIIHFKKLGFLFNSREKNSNILLRELIQLSRQFDFKVIKLRSPPARKRLEWNLQRLIDKKVDVDAVYLPSDSYVVSRAKYVANQLKVANIKSIGAIKKFIKEGILLGSVADYRSLGKQAAMIIDRNQKGKKLENIPIPVPKNPKLVINSATSAALGFTISEDVLKNAVLLK